MLLRALGPSPSAVCAHPCAGWGYGRPTLGCMSVCSPHTHRHHNQTSVGGASASAKPEIGNRGTSLPHCMCGIISASSQWFQYGAPVTCRATSIVHGSYSTVAVLSCSGVALLGIRRCVRATTMTSPFRSTARTVCVVAHCASSRLLSFLWLQWSLISCYDQ